MSGVSVSIVEDTLVVDEVSIGGPPSTGTAKS
jgi:hypothetical protein